MYWSDIFLQNASYNNSHELLTLVLSVTPLSIAHCKRFRRIVIIRLTIWTATDGSIPSDVLCDVRPANEHCDKSPSCPSEEAFNPWLSIELWYDCADAGSSWPEVSLEGIGIGYVSSRFGSYWQCRDISKDVKTNILVAALKVKISPLLSELTKLSHLGEWKAFPKAYRYLGYLGLIY